MRKIGFVASALVILFSLDLASVFAASPAKAGTKCAKAGQTQVVGIKKFTCIKSGSKLTWNKGVKVPAKATPGTSTNNPSPAQSSEVSASPSASPSLVKFKNCTEVKAAGAAPLSKQSNPELYELNAGLDRDKDGVACES